MIAVAALTAFVAVLGTVINALDEANRSAM